MAAQTKKKAQPVNKPVIRATVTVKGTGNYAPPVYPAETDPGVWNDYQTTDGRIRLTFPSPLSELVEDSVVLNNGEKVVSVRAYTKHGSYQVLARPFSVLGDNRDIKEILETSIANYYGGPGVKILRKTDIFYGGIIGKEFVASISRAERTHIQYVRCFILNSHLMLLSVDVDKPSDEEKIKPWIQKFFDSLVVPLTGKNDG